MNTSDNPTVPVLTIAYDYAVTFGVSNAQTVAQIMADVYENNCHKEKRVQWETLQKALTRAGQKATNNTFNAYNQLAIRVQCRQNNEINSGYFDGALERAFGKNRKK